MRLLRGLVFDAVFDEHRGVVIFTKLFDGSVKKQDKIEFIQNKTKIDVSEVGFFSPFLVAKEKLAAGEIGYIVTGIKDIRKTRVGDTITTQNLKGKIQKSNVQPCPDTKCQNQWFFSESIRKPPMNMFTLREAISNCL